MIVHLFRLKKITVIGDCQDPIFEQSVENIPTHLVTQDAFILNLLSMSGKCASTVRSELHEDASESKPTFPISTLKGVP